jgi:hypothetical protein
LEEAAWFEGISLLLQGTAGWVQSGTWDFSPTDRSVYFTTKGSSDQSSPPTLLWSELVTLQIEQATHWPPSLNPFRSRRNSQAVLLLLVVIRVSLSHIASRMSESESMLALFFDSPKVFAVPEARSPALFSTPSGAPSRFIPAQK